jgi:hypothetical protein
MRQLVAVILLGSLVVASNSTAQESGVSGYVQRDFARKDVVVFVHGVTGDAKETWTNPVTGAYWPQIVRSDSRFSDTNVWVFSFASPKLQIAQNVEELALKLGDALSEVIQTHDRLFFVAHSMGGLIVREMLTQKSLPATKVPLIYFFGTPSAGADLAGVTAALTQNPQFKNLKPFTRESDVASFARKWLATSENPGTRYPQRIWSFCAYEIKGLVGNMRIVTELSASYLCSTAPRGSLANHSTMVKPAQIEDEPHQYLLSAFTFARSKQAALLSTSSAISMHSAMSPGIHVDSLQVRYATVSAQDFNVSCGQTRTGKIPVDLSSPIKGRVLTAAKLSTDVVGMRNSQFEPEIEASGGLSLKYHVTGANIDPIGGCPVQGRASVGLQYVIEVK